MLSPSFLDTFLLILNNTLITHLFGTLFKTSASTPIFYTLSCSVMFNFFIFIPLLPKSYLPTCLNVSLQITVSSANIIVHWFSFLTSSATLSITITNKLIPDAVLPTLHLTGVLRLSYTSKLLHSKQSMLVMHCTFEWWLFALSRTLSRLQPPFSLTDWSACVLANWQMLYAKGLSWWILQISSLISLHIGRKPFCVFCWEVSSHEQYPSASPGYFFFD